jgi:LysR family transcriptional activator of nhaA
VVLIQYAIADAPLPPGSAVRAFNHLLLDSGVTWFAERRLARRLRPGFPRSLDGAPVLLPLEASPFRRSLDAWFASLGIRPRVHSEFEDPALLNVFAADGLGAFPGPSVVEEDILHQYRVETVGRTEDVRERFWAISLERRLKNEAVLAIFNAVGAPGGPAQ